MSDPTETIRRTMVQEINADAGDRQRLEEKHGQVWNTQQLQEDFDVLCAHTTTTLERPDSLGRWIFSIDNGGSSWDVVWIGRSWPSGSDGYLDMSERR
jgi:hypothetical protein